MFVVSGSVSALYETTDKSNLRAGMQKAMTSPDVAASTNGISRGAWNSAMRAIPSGGEFPNPIFGCLVGDQIVVGTFEYIEFKAGDEVKAVVTRLNEKLLFAHAVVRPKDGWLWMPSLANKGRWQMAKEYAKLGAWLSAFVWLLLSGMYWLEPLSGVSYFKFSLAFWAITLGLGGIVGPFIYQECLPGSEHAERIMKVLGFKNPRIVNLSPFSEARTGQGSSYQMYDLRKALAAYGSLSTRPPQQAAQK